jgi:serine protease inhibitor
MKMLVLVILLSTVRVFAAGTNASPSTAANAINLVGIDLLHVSGKQDANFLISPYSIQNALAMTYAGAEGKTREEMARVLHYPKDDVELNRSFAALRQSLNALVQASTRSAEAARKFGQTNDPLVLTVANRLFGQQGYDFRAAFLDLVKTNYDAPFAPVDFVRDAAGATKQINDWVEQQTHKRISSLMSTGVLNADTRLVLVNAFYLKASWVMEFATNFTQPGPFQLTDGQVVEVPVMRDQR